MLSPAMLGATGFSQFDSGCNGFFCVFHAYAWVYLVAAKFWDIVGVGMCACIATTSIQHVQRYQEPA